MPAKGTADYDWVLANTVTAEEVEAARRHYRSNSIQIKTGRAGQFNEERTRWNIAFGKRIGTFHAGST
jgi:ribosomal protein L39E